MFHKEENEDAELSSLSMALGAALKTDIKMVANCNIRLKAKKGEDPFKQVLICIGNEKMFLLEQDFKTVNFSFTYDCVNHVVLEKINASSVMILLDEVYDDGVHVPHCYMTFADRDFFLNTFKCYYAVYFADQYSILKDLDIQEKQFVTFDDDDGAAVLDKYKNIFIFPPENHKLLGYKNYFFFLPPVLKETGFFTYTFNIANPFFQNVNKDAENKIDGKEANPALYESNKDELLLKDKAKVEQECKELKCDLYIRMRLEKDLKSLKASKDANNIDFYTYNEFIAYINLLYLNQAKLVISKDHFYFKKYSVGGDYSIWDGWRVEGLLTYPETKKIIFINIRRKFIPPFFETYSDFSIIVFVDLSKLSFNRVIEFKEKENFELNKVLETLVDSIYPDSVLNFRDFMPVLETKFDSLALDYETFVLFSDTLKIYGPQTFKIALKFVLKILDNILIGGFLSEIQMSILSDKKNKDDDFLKQVKTFPKFALAYQKQVLKYFKKDKFKDDPESPKSIEELKLFYDKLNTKEIFQDFKELVLEFIINKKDLFPNNEETIQMHKQIIRNFEEKVCNFLFFLLDGGMCGDLFNIEFILKMMKINKKARVEFSELLLHILVNKFEGENIKNSVSDSISIKKNEYNEILLCKIIKFGCFKEVCGFEGYKLQNELIVYLIDEKWSYEILESIHYHMSEYIDKEEESEVKEYFKNFDGTKRGLVKIYMNDSLNPKVTVLVAKIITKLCTYDDSGLSVEVLINLDIISAISKKILTYDYSLLQANILLLFVISDKIKYFKLTEIVANDKYLYPAFNELIINAKFYDHPLFIFDNLIKVLYNLIASDLTIIQKKLVEQITLDPKNNIAYNIIFQLLINKLNFKEDYKSFVRRCRIEEKVYRFFSLIINKNMDMKVYFKNDINFLKVLSENEIFKDLYLAYTYYAAIYKFNNNSKETTKHADTLMLDFFVEYLRVLFRLFQFVFFLYENSKEELEMIIDNEGYMKDFMKFFDTINVEEKAESVIKDLLLKIRGNEFKDFGSVVFSLNNLVRKVEEEMMI